MSNTAHFAVPLLTNSKTVGESLLEVSVLIVKDKDAGEGKVTVQVNQVQPDYLKDTPLQLLTWLLIIRS